MVGTASSGYYGHPGRPGQVGGSVSTGTKQPYDPEERHALYLKQRGQRKRPQREKKADDALAKTGEVPAKDWPWSAIVNEIRELKERAGADPEAYYMELLLRRYYKGGVLGQSIEKIMDEVREIRERRDSLDYRALDKRFEDRLLRSLGYRRMPDGTYEEIPETAKPPAG